MKKEEIIMLYIGDLKNIVPQSEARDNRIEQLESELQNTSSNSDYAKCADDILLLFDWIQKYVTIDDVMKVLKKHFA